MTGGDTDHYTIEELMEKGGKKSNNNLVWLRISIPVIWRENEHRGAQRMRSFHSSVSGRMNCRSKFKFRMNLEMRARARLQRMGRGNCSVAWCL